MRVPQSSLKNLKAHAELLGNYGVDTTACVTRMSFTNEAFPQLVFTYVSLLDEQQWDWVQELSASPKVRGMLQTPDFENATSTPLQETPAHNRGLAPLPASPPPAGFDALMGQVQAEDEEDEAEEQAPVVASAADIIDLPDGRRYNVRTKEYIEAEPEPEPEPEPAADPDVIELPDGKFFNTRMKQFVAGASPVEAKTHVEAPTPAARKPRAKKAKPQEAATEDAVTQPKPNGMSGVVPAPDALEDMLRSVLPSTHK
jgi:hypothetical protein